MPKGSGVLYVDTLHRLQGLGPGKESLQKQALSKSGAPCLRVGLGDAAPQWSGREGGFQG